MRSLLILSTTAVAIAAPASARADFLLQWNTTSATGPLLDEPAGMAFLAPQLRITDAAYNAGSMNFRTGGGPGGLFPCGPGSFPCETTGDASGAISFFDETVPISYGILAISFSFADLSGSILERGLNTDFSATGSGNVWSASYSADASLCGNCTATGFWTVSDPPSVSVAEPGSLALLAGMLSLGVLTLRRKDNG
jgi:hypothetical protein